MTELVSLCDKLVKASEKDTLFDYENQFHETIAKRLAQQLDDKMKQVFLDFTGKELTLEDMHRWLVVKLPNNDWEEYRIDNEVMFLLQWPVNITNSYNANHSYTIQAILSFKDIWKPKC